MTVDTESIYLGVKPTFSTLTGPFQIVKELPIGMVEIKLLSKKYKNFHSMNKIVTKAGHAYVDMRSVKRCPKITNITDLIKYSILNE